MESMRSNIRALVALRGMKGKDLAERSGVAQSVISSFLSGKTDMSVGRFTNILDALDVDLEGFIKTSSQSKASLVNSDVGSELADIINDLEPVHRDSIIKTIVRTAKISKAAKEERFNVAINSLLCMVEGNAQ